MTMKSSAVSVLLLCLAVFAQTVCSMEFSKTSASADGSDGSRTAPARTSRVLKKKSPKTASETSSGRAAKSASSPSSSRKKTSVPASAEREERQSEGQEQGEKTDAELKPGTFVHEILSKLPPDGIVIGPIDYSGKSWIMNGVYFKPIGQVKTELADAMRAEEYELMHEIPLTDDQSKILIAWKKKDVKLIFMLWIRSDRETGFSWGRSQ